MKNILIVTFPVDLGNSTIQLNLQNIFKDHCDFYSFASDHTNGKLTKRPTVYTSFLLRFKAAAALRRIVKKYTAQKKRIIFQGLSPAIFSIGMWNISSSFLFIDWTRSLYPFVLRKPFKKDIVFYFQRNVIRKFKHILCATEAIKTNLIDVYKIDEKIITKVPVPFYIHNFNIFPKPIIGKPKVLFVGGEFLRKGGDVLLNAWNNSLHSKCMLSVMSNDERFAVPGIDLISNVKYGSEQHRKIFAEHDILILPTRIDSYPQVIGEAAAAGLAVITTKFALAAAEVIINDFNGYISESPEESMQQLDKLLDNHQKINEYKQNAYKLMQEKFSSAIIKEQFFKAIGIL